MGFFENLGISVKFFYFVLKQGNGILSETTQMGGFKGPKYYFVYTLLDKNDKFSKYLWRISGQIYGMFWEFWDILHTLQC